MNHEHFREQMALRLYSELDPVESQELDRHLEHCDECRRFDGELATGLGRVRALAQSSSAAELPADWTERMIAATRSGRLRVSPWWTAVTSFAAGILVAALVSQRAEKPPVAPDEHRVSVDESSYARYLRSTPPPLATGGGQLARLGSYLKR